MFSSRNAEAFLDLAFSVLYLENMRKVRRNLEMAKDKIGGKKTKEISLKYGLSEQRVNAILKNENIADFIEEVTKAITLKEGLEAYKNISYAIQNYRTTDDQQLRSHGFQASMDLMKSIGVLESRNVSISIQNIQNTQNNVVSPMMQELIQKHLGLPKTLDVEVIDGIVEK